METLNTTLITTEIRGVKKILPNLLNYFDQTSQVLEEDWIELLVKNIEFKDKNFFI